MSAQMQQAIRRFEYGTKEVVQYLFSDLRCVYDWRKAVLLAFLAQYEVDGCLVYEFTCGGRPLARANFYIGSGIESDEVYKALKSGGFGRPPREICNYGICYHVDPNKPLPELCYTGPTPQLPKPVADRLDNVLSRFGSVSVEGLVRHVDWLLWLNPWKVLDFDGVSLKKYLSDQGFYVVQVELCGQAEEAVHRQAVGRERRRFKLMVKEHKSGYVEFVADGGDVVVNGVTGRCRGRDVICVRRIVRRMLKAPERPLQHVREVADAVLRRVLQAPQDGALASAEVRIYGGDWPTLKLSVSLERGGRAEVEGCYSGPDTRYIVRRILQLRSVGIDLHVLRRAVVTTIKQAYNAKP